MEKKYRNILSASTLAGDDVRNPQGQDLGKIEELMIDLKSGRVAYAVLSFGGILGLGDKLFAIPWDKLSLSEDEKKFILNVDKTVLEKAKGFDKNNWPDTSNPKFLEETYSLYGSKPYWTDATDNFGGKS